MNVLSLFDGMSCGQIALEKAGIKYNKYFASEIDKYTIEITQKNYPNTIQIGDITTIDCNSLPKIDLLIGGSPCQQFSFAGTRKGMSTKDKIEVTSLDHYLSLKKEGFEFEGQSYLFWEYVRILKELKPKYFLLENVKMHKKWEHIISKEMGVNPVEINSTLFSAQHRRRLYWTNIPILPFPEDKNLLIKDILEPEGIDITERYYSKKEGTLALKKALSNTRTIYQKAKCLTTGGQSIANSGATNIKISDNLIRKLTPIECERLQTVPENYTKGVSNTQRYRMLGNGWTVDVVSHIFKGITIDSKQENVI